MKTKLLLMLSLCASLFISSCSDDKDSDETTVTYTVEVTYPDSYQQASASGVEVKLKNLSNNRQVSVITDENGLAQFSDLAPGNYTLSASKELNETQAEELTGLANEIYLNATVTQLSILGNGNKVVQLQAGVVGSWLIKEFYYSGAPNSYYFFDAFIEIYNNSTETLYADKLLFGSTKSASASNSSYYGFITNGLQDAYLNCMYQIPGSGTDHPVAPGKSIVIAVDAINHKSDPNGNANSPVNLGMGVADFEVFYNPNPSNIKDTDNPDVPNVNILYTYSATAFDYMPGVFGSGLVIFRNDNPEALEKVTEPNSTSATLYVKVPKEDVIDALDAVANASITPQYKRLPTNLDAGMSTVGSSYSGTSLRRKIKKEINNRKVLLDTNNSSNDFEINTTPSPKGW